MESFGYVLHFEHCFRCDPYFTNESRLSFSLTVNLIGLTDYPVLISHPMDLGTVKKKIKNKEYTSFVKCGEDVKLIWNNCMTYNADGSDFYKLAQSLYKR